MLVLTVLRRRTRFRFAAKQIRHFSATDATTPSFPGIHSRFTEKLEFVDTVEENAIPIYSFLTSSKLKGTYPQKSLPDHETLVKMYRDMTTINIMDKILYESQRQGRISFYMTNTGEEATQIGSAAALTPQDTVYAQYREAGVLLWRGYAITEFMNQCYGNCEDPSKGRQMPVHYGSKELNFVTISSPLTTQLPQAVGAAYAMKRDGKEACVICYFGEGAASEGDAHAAFNFAATLRCPVIFFCRNNGYAISTPAHEQFKGDGIAGRGPAYGIRTVRVDGNDVLAVYQATKAARDYCLEHAKPVLIETMTYRIGHHSTSDDSTAYRSTDEIALWNDRTPIRKFRDYLESLGLWCDQREKELVTDRRREILTEFQKAETRLKPSWKELFTDVYETMPQHIQKQMSTMEHHIRQYGTHYPIGSFKPT